MKNEILIANEIKAKVNLNSYESQKVGNYIETSYGDVIITDIPNIYQPIDKRFWIFELTTDETGEPLMDGEKIIIKS